MEGSFSATKTQKFKDSQKYVWLMCALLSVLILARSLNNDFFYVFAVASAFIFLISNTRQCFMFLLFLLPFSTVLKHSVGGISFFTVLFFFAIAKAIIKKGKIDVKLLICLIAFFVYGILSSGIGQFATVATFVVGFLMIYCLKDEDVSISDAIVVFSIGICCASVLALCREFLPIVNRFVNDAIMKVGEDVYATRFTGLQGNPNYFTLDITVAISVILVLMHNKKATPIHSVCLIALSIFGLMSVSKSFLLVWALLMVCWIVISFKQGVRKFAKTMFMIVLGGVIIYLFAYDYINTYILRFIEDEASNIGDITTGRYDLWVAYGNAIFGSFDIFVFGNGINAMLATVGKGAHNTYLECWFNLGIIGITLFVYTLRVCFGKLRLKNAVWIPVVALAVRMLAIGIFTYDNIWFYFAIIYVLIKEFNQNDTKKVKNMEGEDEKDIESLRIDNV